MNQNCDAQTIAGFGRQWRLFDQTGVSEAELAGVFEQYFAMFPAGRMSPEAVGLDAGCGTGRWAQFVAPKTGRLICVDASAGAMEVARERLGRFPNCELHQASIDALPVADASLDFAYCLGVLHYVPDPAAGLRSIARKLKPGAPMLLYVYYAMDESAWWFRTLWKASDLMRRAIARLPFRLRYTICELLAATVYYPLARTALLVEKCGLRADPLPLSQYRRRSFYMMRTDALDRFGNRIEHRFTRQQVKDLMQQSGLSTIRISAGPARWIALGYKTAE